jgi:DNA-binding transcriptional LysR family regulator
MASRPLAKTLARRPHRDWPFVAVWLPSGPVVEESWREATTPGATRVTTNSFHAQAEAVRAGLGVAVLPVVLGEPLGLVAMTLPPELPAPPALDMYLVTPRALRKVPRISVVFDALAAGLSSFGS